MDRWWTLPTAEDFYGVARGDWGATDFATLTTRVERASDAAKLQGWVYLPEGHVITDGA